MTFGHMLDEAEKRGLEQGIAQGEASGRAAEKLEKATLRSNRQSLLLSV